MPSGRIGARHQLIDCDPNCAEGSLIEPAADVKIYRIRTCIGSGGHKHRFYTRVSITYMLDEPFGGIPAGKDTTLYRQHCRH